jgi:nicotinamidase/pyrazinamidase
LPHRGIKRLLVGGLATDYCVKEIILDGIKYGFEIFQLDDASNGVKVRLSDSNLALKIIVAAGLNESAPEN